MKSIIGEWRELQETEMHRNIWKRPMSSSERIRAEQCSMSVQGYSYDSNDVIKDIIIYYMLQKFDKETREHKTEWVGWISSQGIITTNH